ncbi:MAG: 16S rRNA (guanine(966)-N(2))-methyltransferase RsmD [Alphaproteobacteria bacterium]|nr:16S rRNA (guanine(966)-N(2))-methyltransferase RsmD [Alphaproteobacteria bacterium]
MRIVGGRHRGRAIAAPADRSIRPTSDRAREAVFNILAHGDLLPDGGFADLDVVDLFAGTGAMGLEALSRGARHVVFVDNDPAACRLIRDTLQILGETPRAVVVQRDATRLAHRAGAPAGLAFVDPPYGSGLAGPALAGLTKHGWLSPGAVVVVEGGAHDNLDLPDGFAECDRRRYGAARITFLRWGAISDT